MRKIKKIASLLALSLILCASSITSYAYEDEDYDYEENYEEDEYDEDEDWFSDREEYDEKNEDVGWYQDDNGKWHYKDINYEIKDKMRVIDGNIYYFDKNGIMVTDVFYKWTEMGQIWANYFGPDGAMDYGWIQKDGAWHYAKKGSDYFDARHYLIQRGIVCDNGLYYIIDNFKMQTGIYKMDWDTKEYYDANANRTYEFANKIGWNTIDLGVAGGVYPVQLPISNGMPKEMRDQQINDLLGNNTSSANTSSDEEKFAVADLYIAEAMSEHGIYNYQVQSRIGIEAGMLGGFVAVYYVYIPEQHSYKYLRISFTTDLLNGAPIYYSSSL